MAIFYISGRQAQLKGLKFVDNNQTVPWITENGIVSFVFDSYPVQLAFCLKINLDFARYKTFTGLIYIEDMDSGVMLASGELSDSRDYNFVFEFPGRNGDFSWHFGKEKLKANFLRKWVWFCFSMDYKKQSANFSVNGRMIEPVHSPKLTKDIPTCTKWHLFLGQYNYWNYTSDFSLE